MPWNGSGGIPFNHHEVTTRAPSASGVYALFNKGHWIYFGESDDIRASLLEFLDDISASWIAQAKPRLFAYELLVGEHARILRQDALIRENWHTELCNQRLGFI
jgi:hypothetical protein